VILLGIPCLLVITWRGGIFFLLLVDLLLLLGMVEFYTLMAAKGYRPYRALGIFCGLAFSWYVFRGGAAVSLIVTASLLAIMIGELRRRDMDQSLGHIAVTVLGVMYVGWLGWHVVMLRVLRGVGGVADDLGARLVFFTAAVSWAGVTSA
jgi:phosphatidate cytidylyltransferase